MSNHVLAVSAATLQKIKAHYSRYHKAKLPPGAVFVAKLDDCNITGYKSGKVMFQGKGAEEEASLWQSQASAGKGPTASKTRKAVGDHQYAPPSEILHLELIGSDETGTGDYFGPMTVVAAHLTRDQLETVESWGIRDSKTIRDDVIRALAPKLLKECTYGLVVVRNEKYNELNEKGLNQGQMKALMHHQALQKVFKKLEDGGLHTDGVLIDQFVAPNRYMEYLRSMGHSWKREEPLYFATKAEGLHPAVAAASVLARYAFLREMDKLSEQLGVTLLKGASAKVDASAREIVRTHGEDVLKSVTKWHFSNTQRALK
ncbi:ribonuclease HIII [Paenalkalicoccus suaedae]|uniref:Ribonuclease HIII n=1 Tax=Paenalkalicoccus suaedae TaxID=2592382 RepID=A0A859FGS4_9BACI|nr:ribonuclease HIII [Paenalkalicoccus suaedae]QKS72000.1 ribonuclease HIII [Paenalkalicoccus suaedae]